MAGTNSTSLGTPLVHIEAWSAEDDEEIEAIDTDRGIVLDSKINVFLDTEPKVTRVAEVVLAQLILFHLLKQ